MARLVWVRCGPTCRHFSDFPVSTVSVHSSDMYVYSGLKNVVSSAIVQIVNVLLMLISHGLRLDYSKADEKHG